MASTKAGVPFFSISASEFVEIFAGIGASRVRDLFEQASSHFRDAASFQQLTKPFGGQEVGPVHHLHRRDRCSGPPAQCWLWSRPSFSALASHCIQLALLHGAAKGNDEREQTVNQLLTEMDGSLALTVGSPLVVVYWLSTTNLLHNYAVSRFLGRLEASRATRGSL